MPPILKRMIWSEAIADTVFDLPIGTVYGPYIDGVAYKAVKVLDKKVIPDSVDSRHILIRAETADEILAATKTLDSHKDDHRGRCRSV